MGAISVLLLNEKFSVLLGANNMPTTVAIFKLDPVEYERIYKFSKNITESYMRFRTSPYIFSSIKPLLGVWFTVDYYIRSVENVFGAQTRTTFFL